MRKLRGSEAVFNLMRVQEEKSKTSLRGEVFDVAVTVLDVVIQYLVVPADGGAVTLAESVGDLLEGVALEETMLISPGEGSQTGGLADDDAGSGILAVVTSDAVGDDGGDGGGGIGLLVEPGRCLVGQVEGDFHLSYPNGSGLFRGHQEIGVG